MWRLILSTADHQPPPLCCSVNATFACRSLTTTVRTFQTLPVSDTGCRRELQACAASLQKLVVAREEFGLQQRLRIRNAGPAMQTTYWDFPLRRSKPVRKLMCCADKLDADLPPW